VHRDGKNSVHGWLQYELAERVGVPPRTFERHVAELLRYGMLTNDRAYQDASWLTLHHPNHWKTYNPELRARWAPKPPQPDPAGAVA
jgi:hypothetical protein